MAPPRCSTPSPSAPSAASGPRSELEAARSRDAARGVDAAGAAPSFARAYLRARLTAPLRAHTDVPVVLGGDGATVLHHGAPSTWPSGVAERVQAGTLRVGVVRVRTRGAASGAARAPAHRRTASDGGGAAAVQPGPVATRRRSESNSVAGRLKVGVHADQGGCGHMEDMSVVHQSGSAEAPGVHAFCCVYDGHGSNGEQVSEFLMLKVPDLLEEDPQKLHAPDGQRWHL